ncbi:uncharacterized protein LOC112522449 isoform X1 [Cynara cardunculus var. scolymus]|uniref:uncharacterized protein LOC112522449 isoform X1 n=1 Tax=Cynara cardunculus var. scolymus TaxID=59895 RepID=UPI000D62B8D2|nr:uncharacterized protein LOC112522449 isoform X1 [Cynara cardunculus var. scolymus]XP_024987332.1 uncharacterized protein LOC112522449 isoform X1 [Cynara cardunculus var. scolymus]XP_024987333.1 uncharacterized protein LOC112522449 isoform X1 [Cynara cardunculus var. scolymus]
MKESPIRHTNPFLSDEENDKVNFWNNRELELSIVEEDFTTNLESLEKAPSYSLEKAKELYIDKNVECELPELIACYHESGFHVVKDICVDEGVSHGEKIGIHKVHRGLSCHPVTVNEDKHDDMIEEGLGTQFLKHQQSISSPVEECGKNTDLFSVTKEKLHADFPIPKHSISHTNIGYNHDDMIGRNLETQFLKHEKTRSSSGEDDYTSSDSSFGTKEKTDTNVFITEPTDDHRHMGNCYDTKIHGQNSSQGKDCKEDATKVANHSVITDELENVSEDSNGPYNCASDKLPLFVESSTAHSTENCSPDKLMQTGEENIDSSFNSLDNSSREQFVSCSTLSLNQDQLPTSIKNWESSNNGVNDVGQQLSEAQGPVEEILKRHLAGSEAEELVRNSHAINTSTEIKMEENITSNSDNVKPATFSSPECIHELPPDMQSAANHQEETSDNVTESNQLQHGGGESSFSVAGTISGLITYSGPIASSGSMSLRSDGSNTSVRSFAFPILQTEWNSSPVRMAKVDQRRSKKHRGWKQTLMCCKF